MGGVGVKFDGGTAAVVAEGADKRGGGGSGRGGGTRLENEGWRAGGRETGGCGVGVRVWGAGMDAMREAVRAFGMAIVKPTYLCCMLKYR